MDNGEVKSTVFSHETLRFADVVIPLGVDTRPMESTEGIDTAVSKLILETGAERSEEVVVSPVLNRVRLS